jgi:hypothetical protein
MATELADQVGGQDGDDGRGDAQPHRARLSRGHPADGGVGRGHLVEDGLGPGQQLGRAEEWLGELPLYPCPGICEPYLAGKVTSQLRE